jgi:hypothetical protein
MAESTDHVRPPTAGVPLGPIQLVCWMAIAGDA